MTWNRERAVAAARTGGNRGLEKAAAYLEDRAKQLVPVDTGETRDSADSGLLHDGDAVVVFTDSKAVALHEDLHHRHSPGKRAKYLEQPLHTEQRRLLELIAEGIRGGLLQ